MNTLPCFMEVNGFKSQTIESLPASDFDHLLSKYFMNARGKNGTSRHSFQRSIKPFNILKDNEFEKSRRVLVAKRKSLVHEHGKGHKPQATLATDENEDVLFETGEFGDSNPVALQRTVWWLFFLYTLVSEPYTLRFPTQR